MKVVNYGMVRKKSGPFRRNALIIKVPNYDKNKNLSLFKISVGDLDPHVFGPPGS
jgi:hypothetical protein